MTERKMAPAMEEAVPVLEEQVLALEETSSALAALEVTVGAMDESTAIARLTREIASCHMRLEMLNNLRSLIRKHKKFREVVEKPLYYMCETDDDDPIIE